MMHDCDQLDPNMPVIELTLNQVGVIILFESGVIYQNQTCNVACAQRCEEGILLLPTDPALVEGAPVEVYQCPIEAGLRKLDWGPVRGISLERASEIDHLLHNYGMTKKISVDRSRLGDSEEAWVYVTVEPVEHGFPYRGFGSCRGILVWANSD